MQLSSEIPRSPVILHAEASSSTLALLVQLLLVNMCMEFFDLVISVEEEKEERS